jgi:tetratricopeptide (TPR) repeat protein
MPEQAPTVFISYSHDSYEHQDEVLDLSNALLEAGINVIIDAFAPNPPEGWHRWMENNLDAADFVLMICTDSYYKRVKGLEEPGKGFGVRWEGTIIYARIYESGALGAKYIPILLEETNHQYIPLPLKSHTRYLIANPNFKDRQFEDLYRHLTNQPAIERPTQPRPLVTLPPRRTYRQGSAMQSSPTQAVEVPGSQPRLKKGQGGREDVLRKRIAVLLDESDRLWTLGFYELAMAQLDRLPLPERSSVRVIHRMWMIQCDMRNGGEALKLARQVQAQLPTFAFGFFMEAATLTVHEDLTELSASSQAMAMDAYNKAMSREFVHSNDFSTAANLAAQLGNFEAAENWIKEGLERFRDNPRLLRARADTWYRQGKSNEARDLLLGMLKDHRPTIDLHQIGSSLGRHGDYDCAIQAFKRALELNPDDPEAEYYIACCYARQADPENAIKFLMRAIVLNPFFQQRARLDQDFVPIREHSLYQLIVYDKTSGQLHEAP